MAIREDICTSGRLSPGRPHPSLSFPAVLAEDGHQVLLEKIEDWNVVELMVNGEVVFRCNIKDLEFGKPSHPRFDLEFGKPSHPRFDLEFGKPSHPRFASRGPFRS